GVRASLRSVHFQSPFVGWAAGREEMPNGGGSVGVLLFTRDGGVKWQRVVANAMPGLNFIRFFDAKTGFVLGDGGRPYPTGLFQTTDGGRTWQPVPGPRCPSLLAAAFQDGQTGVLVGAWSRLAVLRQGKFAITDDVDRFGGLTLRGLQALGNRLIAVGQ